MTDEPCGRPDVEGAVGDVPGHHRTRSHDGSGSDIGPLKELNVPCMELMPDSQRYFDYHHTQIDTMDAVNKRELELGDAAMAGLVWMISQYGLFEY